MNGTETKKCEYEKGCACGHAGETGHNDCCRSEGTTGKPVSGMSGGNSDVSPRVEKEFHGLKIYPGQVIKWKGKKPLPNDRCHCGSGKKFKKCCGR
jgi:hypothetical protein